MMSRLGEKSAWSDRPDTGHSPQLNGVVSAFTCHRCRPLPADIFSNTDLINMVCAIRSTYSNAI